MVHKTAVIASVPENNLFSLRFTVTDSLSHRADFSAESTASTSGWVGGDNARDMVGVGYDVYEEVEVESITAYLSTYYDDAFAQFQYVLAQWLPEEEIYNELLTSEIYDMEEDMAHTWLTLNLEKDGESEFLQPGYYVACVKMWGEAEGDEDGICGMRIGWDTDNDNKSPRRYTMMYQAVSDEWFTTAKLNMIGMVINNNEGPTASSATFNVDMNAHIQNGEFNPNSDFVDVAGTFNEWTGSDPLTDEDGDGIFSISIENLPVGEKLEYKFRINGNWDTSEFADGGPNRTYIVRYWNVVNNIYNNGITTGLDNIQSVEVFNVYPNPTTGQFTVEIANSNSSDLTIKLYNLQGKVVYTKALQGVANHKEAIDENLVKGLYFLSIESNKGIKTQKIIVK